MTDLVDTTEMYLRTILDLEEEGITPLRARISDRLGHSGPTVSQTVARMERDGLVVVAPDRHLELTEDGRALAIRVLRKHRLAERLLADVIGLDWSLVHDEACRWEHVMSEQVERRLLTLLGNPSESPYGTPIPGLAELGLPPAASFLDGVVRATDARGVRIVRRLGEPIQFDIEGLAELQAAGVVPGATVEVATAGDRIRLTASGGAAIDLPVELAQHIYLEA
ncbi:metal-dependent transcriptional regulator [Agrococcus sp. ARC_14]|uniref:metal-dependent transcriptional regulator n=1 Tax=Agrococcus sp. ARC_14 TaxID=2919927 RepID=UPI001F070F85|nr:metal-dependent transcriptional regulator [Agrococcus sp. ARC_14]MCH1884350.1 MarR family transcriptional regulator [Agrococcus sp. ARC_14]